MKERKRLKLTIEVKLGIVIAPVLGVLYLLAGVSLKAYRADPLDDWATFFGVWGGIGYGACFAFTFLYVCFSLYKIACRLGIPAHWQRLVHWVSTDD